MLLAAGLLLASVVGSLWPDAWWGSHFSAFVAPGLRWTLHAGVLLALFWAWRSRHQTIDLNFSATPALRYGAIAVASLAVALVCFHIPIAGDYYGNARTFLPTINDTASAMPDNFWSSIFSLKLEPGQDRQIIFALVNALSYTAGCSIYDAFLWMNAVAAGLLVAIWLTAVQHFIKPGAWRGLLCIVGLANPFLLALAGHLETYAPAMVLLLVWLLLLMRHMNAPRPVILWSLLVLLVMGPRFHPFFVLLAPVWLLAAVHQYAKSGAVRNLLTLKGSLLWLGIPVLLVGLIAYFFVLRDYNDPRILDGNFKDIDRLFLPLLSPEAPWDRYNLLSFNHAFDLGNAILLLAPVTALLLIGLGVTYRKHIRWNEPTLVVLLVALLMQLAFASVINPLMSLPMDWDVFVLPAMVALVLLLVLIQQLAELPMPRSVFISSMAIVPLALLPWLVLSNTHAHSYRMESVAVHVFKTYYGHSGTYALYALQMLPNDPGLYEHRQVALIDKLKPHALPGNDPRFAEIVFDRALFQLNVRNNVPGGIASLERTLRYAPAYNEARYELMQQYSRTRQFDLAAEHAIALTEVPYPTLEEALRNAVLTTNAAGLTSQANELLKQYHARIGPNAELDRVINALP